MNKCVSVFTAIILLAFFNTQAQIIRKGDPEKAIVEFLKITNDADLKTATPEKWKNESAVIVSQDFAFYAECSNMILTSDMTFRQRFRLQDKAAVSRFSEVIFYDMPEDKRTLFGIRIIKPDGKEIELNIADAVEISVMDVHEESVFIDPLELGYASEKNYRKIAVPQLEIGDEIEFYGLHYLKTSYQITIAAPFGNLYLNHNYYPVLKQSYEFNMHKSCSYRILTVNGCPSLNTDGQGSNIDRKPNPEYSRFSVADSNREKFSDERFLLYGQVYPQIKFHVTSHPSYSKHWLSESDFNNYPSVVDKKIHQNDLLEMFRTFDHPIYDYQAKYSAMALSEYFDKNMLPEHKAEMVYYYLRGNHNYSNFYDAHVISAALMKNKIDHRIVAVIPRSAGTLGDIVSDNEIIFGVEIGCDTENPVCFFSRNYYHNVSEYHYLVDGAEAYAYYPAKSPSYKLKQKNRPPYQIVMPVRESDENNYKTILHTSFDFENECLNADAQVLATGYRKQVIIENVLTNDEIQKEYDALFSKSKKPVQDAKTQEREKLKHEEDIKTRNDAVLELLKNDYEIGKLKSVEMLNTGCFKNSELAFKQSYTINHVFTKAGRNIILDLGKLAGLQIELEDKDLIREHDVFYAYRGMNSYDIYVTIPDGYSVENLNDFNINIDNECMSLFTSAEVQNNDIHFTFRKVYKSFYDPKENWPKYVEVLEAAYNITQKKVVLKKI